MPERTDRGTARDPHEVIHPNHDPSAVRVPDTDDLAGVGPLGVTVVVHEDEDYEFQPPKGRLRATVSRSEEHTSELQSRQYLVCRLLLEKQNHIDRKRIRLNS